MPFAVRPAVGMDCGGGLPQLLEPGAQLRVQVSYAPVAPVGPDEDVLRIADGDGGITDVPLRGNGLIKPAPAIEICTSTQDAPEPRCAAVGQGRTDSPPAASGGRRC